VEVTLPEHWDGSGISTCSSHAFWDLRSVGGTVVSDSDIDNYMDDYALFDILVNNVVCSYIEEKRILKKVLHMKVKDTPKKRLK
jgi:hypothetical protein